MALYYFHLRDGEDVLLDPEGLELPDVESIRHSALASARSILSAEVLTGRLPLYMRIDVEDGAGALVHRLPFDEAVAVIS